MTTDPAPEWLSSLPMDRPTELHDLTRAGVAALSDADRRGVSLVAGLIDDEGFTLIIRRGDAP